MNGLQRRGDRAHRDSQAPAEPLPRPSGAPQAPGTAASDTELLFPLHLAQKSATGRVTEVAAALCPVRIQGRVESSSWPRVWGCSASPRAPAALHGLHPRGFSPLSRAGSSGFSERFSRSTSAGGWGEPGGDGSPGAAGSGSRLSESLAVNSAANCSGGKNRNSHNHGSLGCGIIRSDGSVRGGAFTARSVPSPVWRDRPCPRPPLPPSDLHVEFSPAGARKKRAREAQVMRRGRT